MAHLLLKISILDLDAMAISGWKVWRTSRRHEMPIQYYCTWRKPTHTCTLR